MGVLVTGGTGYIGSHTVVELIKAGYAPIIVDNLVNSSEKVLDKIETITGVKPKFYKTDLIDITELDAVFEKEEIDSVIHFAALKAVGESVENPLKYYSNNLIGTLNVLQVMKKHGVNNFVFSSSAAVYGNPETNPILENFPLSTANPYGSTKLMIEDILRDICNANSLDSPGLSKSARSPDSVDLASSASVPDSVGLANAASSLDSVGLTNAASSASVPDSVGLTNAANSASVPDSVGLTNAVKSASSPDSAGLANAANSADTGFNVAILRYFNAVGAHKSGLIGEAPNGLPNNGIPNNIMPYITKVATGELEYLSVFGSDYDTHDGTGVRDYIHVVDLADGHLKALEKLKGNPGLITENLGTGVGYSVLDLVKAFEKASGVEIPYRIVDRRPGDIATCYANPRSAKNELGWEAKYGIDEMCEDSWRWAQNGKE